MSGTTARKGISRRLYGSIAEGSAFEDQVANQLPQQDFESSRFNNQSKLVAKEEITGDKKGSGKFCCTKHLTHALWGSFTCRKCTTWDRRFFVSSKGNERYRLLSHIKTHRPRPGRNPQLWVPWVSWQALKPIDTYILLRTLSSNTLSLFSSHNVTYQVLYQES
jgi:hypothetical protein